MCSVHHISKSILVLWSMLKLLSLHKPIARLVERGVHIIICGPVDMWYRYTCTSLCSLGWVLKYLHHILGYSGWPTTLKKNTILHAVVCKFLSESGVQVHPPAYGPVTIVNIWPAVILEEPKAQYAVIGKNATFTCSTIGIEAYWVLNTIPMTITYPQEKMAYEDQGVTFLEDITQEYYNLTMIVEASLALNNTVIFCSVIAEDYTIIMSQEV